MDILPLISGPVDPQIFEDPDQRGQNVADPMDPDPKHWYHVSIKISNGRKIKIILTNAISFSTLFLTASIPRQANISQISLEQVLTGSTSLSART